MSEWQKVKIGDVCTITKGAIGIQKAVAGKYPMVTLAEEKATHNEFQFDCDAVIVPLVSSTGHGHASMKRVHYQEGKFALGSILCAVVPNDLNFLNPKYLHIYLSYLKDKLLVPLMRGAANVSLSVSKIKTVEIIVPPIEKQIEVIELEKKVRSKRHKLDEQNNEQNKYLVLLRQQILQDAVSGKLTADWRVKNPDIEPASKLLEQIKANKEKLIAEKKIKKEKPLPKITTNEVPFELPEKWKWCRLGSVFSSTSGGTPTRGDHNFWSKGDINWLKSGELNDGIIDFESDEKITKNGLEKSSTFLFPKETVLIAMYGATAGKLAILDIESTTNQAICGFLKNSFIEQKFLFHFLRATRKKMVAESWGQAQPNISQTYLKNFLFTLPPLAEQKAIVDKIEKLMEHVSKLEERIKQNKQDAQMLMQSFLVEAFKN